MSGYQNSGEQDLAPAAALRPGESIVNRWCRTTLISRLQALRYGYLVLREDGVAQGFGDSGSELSATIDVVSAEFYRQVLFGGTVGSGEAYMDGLWRCSDLTALIRIILINSEVLAGLDSGWGRLTMPLHRLYHMVRRNTRTGSRENIAAHYDLGNDFYSLFLDSTMAYSSGVFTSEQCSLKEASLNKFRRICEMLELKKTDHLLEIGTGWGGFAAYAAANYGCRVTTVTISREQFRLAKERIALGKLDKQVTVELQDYRDIRGSFDKLVSIEMIEAVGHHYFDTFFQCCSNLLKPTGRMLLQAITIRDHLYEAYLKEVDFIRRYIFPGACLPSLATIMQSVAKSTDMTVVQLEDIAPHYARTLNVWRQRFMDRLAEVRKLGKSERFIKMWEFYLCYCEAGFLERHLGDIQVVFAKPAARPPLKYDREGKGEVPAS